MTWGDGTLRKSIENWRDDRGRVARDSRELSSPGRPSK
jgi:hypothetical protein